MGLKSMSKVKTSGVTHSAGKSIGKTSFPGSPSVSYGMGKSMGTETKRSGDPKGAKCK